MTAKPSPERQRSENNVTHLKKERGLVRTRSASRPATRIYLQGELRAEDRPGGDNILPLAVKTRAVFGYLCLAKGERLPRSRIAGLVWNLSSERQARDSLRHALHELDRIGSWRLRSDQETVQFDATGCWIDAFDAPAQSELLLADLYGAISAAYDRWLLTERTRFEARWQASFEGELRQLVEEGAPPDQRVAAARKLLNFLPTHESAVRELMAAFDDRGDAALAVQEYERFRFLLHNQLKLPLSPKTMALYQEIQQGARQNSLSVATDSRQTPALGRVLDFGRPTKAAEPPRGSPLAVLPLANLSGEPGHDYVIEGLVEDLVEGLSRVPSLFVVSRLSSAAFRNTDRPLHEIGAALGVRYVLSGSVRVTGEQLRLTIELADAEKGIALWRNRFDEKTTDLLDMQNRLAEAVVRSVAPNIHLAELNRIHRKRSDDHDACDLFLRAQHNMHDPSRAVFESAGPLFAAAIAREPDYAFARAWFAHWHVLRVAQGWSPNPTDDTAQAEARAREAVECDRTEPMALAVQGHIAGYLHRDFDLAFSRFDTALCVNPNSARAWLWNSYTHAWTGNGDAAVSNINRAMALSPYDPLKCTYSAGASLAYLAAGEYGRALEFALRCVGENRGYITAHKEVIIALALDCREKEARSSVNQLMLLEPGFSVEKFRNKSPAGTGELGERFCDALARAGVPLTS